MNIKGFTLLELLVATSIGVVLIVAAGSIIKTTVRLMARGEKWLEGDFKEASVLEFWREQVSAIRTVGSAGTFFVGKKAELSYVTPVALNVRGHGLVVAHYLVKEEGKGKYSLVYKEKRFTTTSKAQKDKGAGPEAIVFLKGYDGIIFEYLGKVKEAENPWKPQWVGGENIPMALRFTLVQGKEQETLIAPIVAISFSLSSGQ